MSYHIASVSFGKDSLAMLHLLIEKEYPLDEVVFYDTGAEFKAIYAERDRVLPLLEEHGITYTELKPSMPFFYKMFATPVHDRKTDEVYKYGYGWCGDGCRWETGYKIGAIDKLAREHGAIVYEGIAADEHKRIEKKRELFKELPLVEWGMTEADCLKVCYERGHEWLEDGVRLYDVLDRVSCWCCRNKNEKELKAIHDHLPEYWERLRGLEILLGRMKNKPLPRIGAGL